MEMENGVRTRYQLGDPRCVARGSGCAAQWNGEWKLKLVVFQVMEKLLRVPRLREGIDRNCFQPPFYKILATFTAVQI